MKARQRQVVEVVLAGRSFGEPGAEASQHAAEPSVAQEAQVTSLVVHDVAVIAGKQLVAAVPRQDDLDVPPGQPGHQVGGDRRRVGERLVDGRQHLLEHPEISRLDEQFMVFRP